MTRDGGQAGDGQRSERSAHARFATARLGRPRLGFRLAPRLGLRSGLGLGRLGFSSRIAVIVTLAIVALLALSGVLAFLAREPVTTRAVPLVQRIAAVVELLEAEREPVRIDLILKAANADDLTIALLDADAIANALPQADRLPGVEWMVQQYLPTPQRHVVRAVFQPREPDVSLFRFLERFSPVSRAPLKVAVRLSDGRHATFTTKGSPARSLFGVPPGFVLGLAGAVLALLAVVAVMREARPLQDLQASVTAFADDARPRTVPARGAPDLRGLIVATNAMQGRIAELLRGRTVLLGAISHDMRTFLTRLRLRVEAMPDEMMRARAVGDLETMAALLDDALALAKTSSGERQAEPVDLAALLASEVRERDGEAVTFSGPMPATPRATDLQPVPVRADALALRRLFNNLIDNGLRYGDRVEVCLAVQAGWAQVTVDDDGPGIPASERQTVFEPFYRLDPSRSHETGGSGLGLAIVRQIAETHGGRVSVADAPLGGARLDVALPLAG